MNDAHQSLLTPRRGDANVAAFLTWFLPGAGHLYLGEFGVGVLLFVLLEGLFFAGLKLSGGMTFEFLDPELRSLVAPVLSPEIGNLGGLLWQMKQFGFGNGHMRPWPDTIVLGSMCTALSGVGNGIAIAHAHTLARTSDSSKARAPVLATLAAWLVPGLGHFVQGRKARGLIVFVLIVGLFALASVLAEGSNLSRERHFYYWAGQFMAGLPALAAELAFGDMRVTRDIPYVECGLVLGCVAGMLNVLALIDVYGWGEAKAFGLPLKASHVAEPVRAPDEVGA